MSLSERKRKRWASDPITFPRQIFGNAFDPEISVDFSVSNLMGFEERKCFLPSLNLSYEKGKLFLDLHYLMDKRKLGSTDRIVMDQKMSLAVTGTSPACQLARRQ